MLVEKEKGFRLRWLFFCGVWYVDGNVCFGVMVDGLLGWV